MHRGNSRRKRTVFGLLAALLALALAAAACGGDGQEEAGGDGQGEQTWVHGILEPKVDAGYFLMAEEKGYFDELGVNVEIKRFTGNVQVVQALVSGAIDSADSSPGPLYDATVQGAEVKAIGSTLPKITYSLLAKSSIKSFEDLQGKTIGVSAPGSFPDEVARAMLAAEGLNPKDLDVVNAGSDADRFKALLNGRVDAAAVAPGFAARIEDNPDFHVLGEASDIIPDYPRFFLFANEESLQNKPEAAVNFLAGQMKGLCHAVQNPQEEIELTAKTLGTEPDDPGITYMNEVVSNADAASPTMAIPRESLEFLQQFRVENGFQEEEIDISEVVEPSYREKALDRAGLPQECLDDPNAEQ